MISSTIKKWGIIASGIFFLIACTPERKNYFCGMGLGSPYAITYIGKENKQLQHKIDSIIKDFSKTLSIFDTNSLLTKVNANKSVELNKDFIDIFITSQRISKMTMGAFDPTVAPLVNSWGFGREQKRELTQYEIDSLKQFVGYDKVSLKKGILFKNDPRIQLNFNAIAEGYIVDKIIDFMIKQGYPNCLIYVGGEVRSNGNKLGEDWQIGIQLPTSTANGSEEIDYIFYLKDKAVSTSGNYRKYQVENGQRFSHIINPKTGRSEKSNLLSVTVVADKCLDADALATAFMVMGLNDALVLLKIHPEYAAYFIFHENGKIKHKKTSNFPEEN